LRHETRARLNGLRGLFPLVVNAKLEIRQGRGGPDRIDGRKKIINRNAIDQFRKLLCSCHSNVPFLVGCESIAFDGFKGMARLA
jgi:hypothetical protein